jgi:microcystin-dependent protein
MANNDDITDYNYPNIEPTDYIDESLPNILARDDASKHGFRRVSTFPTVTTADVGMKVYMMGRGNFQLISADPEPQWKQLSEDNRNPAYTDWVKDNYQPLSKILTILSKLKEAQQAVPYFNGPEDMQAVTITRYMLALFEATDDAEVRELLNLGSAATIDVPIDGKYIADGSITMDKVSTQFKQSLGWTTGDAKLTFKKTADEGWIMLDDGSIGSSASGATTRANSDTYDLFMLMWDIPYCEIQTFSGTSSTKTTAIQDWSANKRLVLPKFLGRAIACAGQGSGLTKRSLGESLGEENTVLGINQLPRHNHGDLVSIQSNVGSKNGRIAYWVGSRQYNRLGRTDEHTIIEEDDYYAGTAEAGGGGNAGHNTMQPTTFVNVMLKL